MKTNLIETESTIQMEINAIIDILKSRIEQYGLSLSKFQSLVDKFYQCYNSDKPYDCYISYLRSLFKNNGQDFELYTITVVSSPVLLPMLAVKQTVISFNLNNHSYFDIVGVLATILDQYGMDVNLFYKPSVPNTLSILMVMYTMVNFTKKMLENYMTNTIVTVEGVDFLSLIYNQLDTLEQTLLIGINKMFQLLAEASKSRETTCQTV